jgi:hypothetical protein
MNHIEAFFAQRLDNEFADQGIVLDDKYSHRRLLNSLDIWDEELPNLYAVPTVSASRAHSGDHHLLSTAIAGIVDSAGAALVQPVSRVRC